MFNSVSRLITCSPPSWFRLRSSSTTATAATSSIAAKATKNLFAQEQAASSSLTNNTSDYSSLTSNNNTTTTTSSRWEGVGTEAAANAIAKSKNIVFVLGAGISAPYLPDFRTPEVGLYALIRKSGKFDSLEGSEILKECPEEIFTPEFIQRFPKLFFRVVEEMKLWPACRDIRGVDDGSD